MWCRLATCGGLVTRLFQRRPIANRPQDAIQHDIERYGSLANTRYIFSIPAASIAG
jgi:hypothetical protein